MLPAPFRLRNSGRIKYVLRKGEAYFSPSLVLNQLKKKDNQKQFAFIASKKVGNAVERNRAVRLLREAVRHTLDEFPDGFDYVLVAKGEIGEKKTGEVQAELKQILEKLVS